MATPLLIGPEQIAAIQALRDLAIESPVDMESLADLIKLPAVKAKHMAQMSRQTIDIPFGFMVTYSVEKHAERIYRHMSMSSPAEGRVPSPEGIWMVAVEFGFTGGLDECRVWLEDLREHGKAVNLIQHLGAGAEVTGNA